jgi:hypothetical protein
LIFLYFIIEDIVNPQINNNNNNKDNNKVLNGKKEIQRLSTTDSMQEFLEIPDNSKYIIYYIYIFIITYILISLFIIISSSK